MILFYNWRGLANFFCQSPFDNLERYLIQSGTSGSFPWDLSTEWTIFITFRLLSSGRAESRSSRDSSGRNPARQASSKNPETKATSRRNNTKVDKSSLWTKDLSYRSRYLEHLGKTNRAKLTFEQELRDALQLAQLNYDDLSGNYCVDYELNYSRATTAEISKF